MATTEQKMLSAELNTLNLNKPDMSGQAGSDNSQNNSTNNSHKSNLDGYIIELIWKFDFQDSTYYFEAFDLILFNGRLENKL